MAQTVDVTTLHAAFRSYFDRQNALLMPTEDPDEIDMLLNFAQRQIQGDEYRPYKTPDGRGFEMSHERKRNLQVFINADPVENKFTNPVPAQGQPIRMPLPEGHRYTVRAEVSWVGLEDVFYPIRPFTHDEWGPAQRNAHLKAVYWDPAMVMHDDLEELLPVDHNYQPHTVRRWFMRLPAAISFANGVGMELPEWMQERLITEAVLRAKGIAEVAGINFSAALRELSK